MLHALTGLILCQFAGEVIARAAGLAVPGPVLGLVLLLHETAGASGGLAISLNGIVTALIVPPSARWLTG